MITQAQTLDYVIGYCMFVARLANRVWRVVGRGCRYFRTASAALGTRDDITNAQNLALWLEVNSVRRQESNTEEMIFLAGGRGVYAAALSQAWSDAAPQY
ncbi:fumarylacetoacetate hydrolase family protein [Sodalis sp.]|uniref:fumarylacetoacetate hydrolase family protein n=1 Tax=Sodalis sp. (in: enterobacteria) TaxID=1898979 RepID=UPI0038734542